jgi:hypothetical protein
VPPMDSCLRPGDTLIVYGRADALAGLERRRASPAGEADRRQAERTEQLRRRLEREMDRTRSPDAPSGQ